eukprot:scaffold648428_cov48-Prasinocladus_malaysianus.AAC.1
MLEPLAAGLHMGVILVGVEAISAHIAHVGQAAAAGGGPLGAGGGQPRGPARGGGSARALLQSQTTT